MCDLDPKVKVIGKKAGIWDGVISTSALVKTLLHGNDYIHYVDKINMEGLSKSKIFASMLLYASFPLI